MPEPTARLYPTTIASSRPMRSDAAEIVALFAALERNLARLPSDGDRAVYVNLQIEAWEGRERAMERWAHRHPRGENLFAPWTAFSVAIVLARLGALHAALIDKIRTSIACATAALPAEYRGGQL